MFLTKKYMVSRLPCFFILLFALLHVSIIKKIIDDYFQCFFVLYQVFHFLCEQVTLVFNVLLIVAVVLVK